MSDENPSPPTTVAAAIKGRTTDVVDILGERVRMNSVEVTDDMIVSFEKKYVATDPGQTVDPIELQNAKIVFSNVFHPKANFNRNRPKYPCNADEYHILRKGLETRRTNLKREIKAIEKGTIIFEEHVEHFNLLTSVIDVLEEKFRVGSKDDCEEYEIEVPTQIDLNGDTQADIENYYITFSHLVLCKLYPGEMGVTVEKTADVNSLFRILKKNSIGGGKDAVLRKIQELKGKYSGRTRNLDVIANFLSCNCNAQVIRVLKDKFTEEERGSSNEIDVIVGNIRRHFEGLVKEPDTTELDRCKEELADCNRAREGEIAGREDQAGYTAGIQKELDDCLAKKAEDAAAAAAAAVAAHKEAAGLLRVATASAQRRLNNAIDEKEKALQAAAAEAKAKAEAAAAAAYDEAVATKKEADAALRAARKELEDEVLLNKGKMNAAMAALEGVRREMNMAKNASEAERSRLSGQLKEREADFKRIQKGHSDWMRRAIAEAAAVKGQFFQAKQDADREKKRAEEAEKAVEAAVGEGDRALALAAEMAAKAAAAKAEAILAGLQAKSELANLAAQLAGVQGELQTTRSEGDMAAEKAAVDARERAIQAAKGARKGADKRARDAEEKRALAEAAAAAAGVALAGKQQEVDQLKSKLRDSNALVDSLKTQLGAAKIRLDQLEARLAAQTSSATAEIAKLNAEIAKLKERIAELKGLLAAEKAKVLELQGELDAKGAVEEQEPPPQEDVVSIQEKINRYLDVPGKLIAKGIFQRITVEGNEYKIKKIPQNGQPGSIGIVVDTGSDKHGECINTKTKKFTRCPPLPPPRASQPPAAQSAKQPRFVYAGPSGRTSGWAGTEERAREMGAAPHMYGGNLEDKVEELCRAYVTQTNNLMKILIRKGYLPRDSHLFELPNMTNEGLNNALERLLIDMERNPVEADLDVLPSIREIMEELDGVYVDPADIGETVQGRRVKGSSDIRLSRNNRIEDLPRILRSLKDDNHKLIRLHMDIKDAASRMRADKPIKKYGSVLDALLDEF